ncbi:MAG: Mut7-C RNAse domain-containing protein [Candidatus Zixiibacteriota bacterium]|nr:MAG: Mut7-C RNAse domain-containing protein [candidate division Zixibacteria bacterium]
MKFICDDNLGKLASYLRILGFDTSFDEDIDDNSLLKTASFEKRTLLTRDRKLASRTHPYGFLLIEDDDPLRQLNIVATELDLKVDPRNLFNRCSKCNEICHTVDKDAITEEVFPFILKTQDTIKQCPSCKRYYWKGSHYKNILKKLIAAVPKKALTGTWPEF